MVSKVKTIRLQAEQLAKANAEAEPSIQAVYWFPHDQEIRLIEVDRDTVPSDVISVFYFKASPKDQITCDSAVAIIRPEEVGKLEPPEGWGSWDEAEIIVSNSNSKKG